MDKKGSINWHSPQTIIYGVILLVVIFQVLASLIGTLQTAGTTLNTSGLPIIGPAFASSGAYGFIIIGAAVLLGVIAIVGLATVGHRK